MALLQISEPGLSTEPHKRNIAIGIDLGTTNSLVASVKSGEAVVLSDHGGNKLIPSIVHYTANQTQIGNSALSYRISDPQNTIVSVKRFMGKSQTDLDLKSNYPYSFATASNIVEIITPQGKKNPIQISGDILRYLKDLARDNLGEEAIGAVITVPAYFDDSQRQATKQAAQLAGLNVLRLLNEPTAAAIAYGLDTKNEGKFLVYDLGGGTLDVSILSLTKGVFEVLAVSGDTNLGGDDFDHLIYEYFVQHTGLTELDHRDNANILVAAKKAKEQLSSKSSTDIVINLKGKIHSLNLSQADFFSLSQTLLDKAITPVKKALRDAKLKTHDIDEVIMVGGSTRMLNVRSAISQFFAKPVLIEIDPDQVVAIGAAIQANVLAGNRSDDDWLLLDVTPLSLGIETMGGLVEKIIPRNSTIPVTKAQDFTTYKDGQTGMSLHIVQGEREQVEDCRSLAKFSLKGIPPMTASAPRIRIVFQIDADGLLSVSATEQTTGVHSSIEVKPSFGLSGEQITSMLEDSITHAVDDVLHRQLAEATIEANGLIDTIQAALKLDAELLNTAELEQITQQIAQLNSIISQPLEVRSKTQELKVQITALNVLTQDFAAQRMNKALKSGLTGHSIEQI